MSFIVCPNKRLEIHTIIQKDKIFTPLITVLYNEKKNPPLKALELYGK